MLDGLLDTQKRRDPPTLNHDLLDKLLNQAVVQSIGMDDRNLTRSLSILRKHLPLLELIEQKRVLASRAQHFIDRFTDVLARGTEHDYTQVFFAN